MAMILLSCQTQKKIVDKQIYKSKEDLISYSVKGKGETIVFIHAGGLDKNMWKGQMKTFSKYAKVIAYDLRGHGQSKNSRNLDYEIDDLISILEEEKIDSKINLVGCSLGAIVALDFALAYPDRLEKLVLSSPGLIGFQEKNKEFLQQIGTYVKAIQANDQEGMLMELKKMNAIGKEQRSIETKIDKYVEDQLKKFIESGNHLRVPKFKELAPLNKVDDLEVETLILYGALDFDYIKENAQKLKEEINNSELFEIYKAAHLLNLENEESFNEKLLKFLSLN